MHWILAFGRLLRDQASHCNTSFHHGFFHRRRVGGRSAMRGDSDDRAGLHVPEIWPSCLWARSWWGWPSWLPCPAWARPWPLYTTFGLFVQLSAPPFVPGSVSLTRPVP